MEMSLNPEIVQIACEVIPDQATLVLEKRQEITTEGGPDVCAEESRVKETVARLHDKGIRVSLFLDPDEKQIEAAKRCGSDAVELHTGKYADAASEESRSFELARLLVSGELITRLGMRLHAGHGLNFRNVAPIAMLPYLAELNIGHGIIARAILFGLERAVKEMKQIIVRTHGEMRSESLENVSNHWQHCHTRALARWIKAGRPVRSPEETQAIYQSCKKCSVFDEATNICKHCGCRVAGHANPLMNRIAIGTEKCPVGKWPRKNPNTADAEPYE
jgi:pyridoxine 5-phosphate synthase